MIGVRSAAFFFQHRLNIAVMWNHSDKNQADFGSKNDSSVTLGANVVILGGSFSGLSDDCFSIYVVGRSAMFGLADQAVDFAQRPPKFPPKIKKKDGPVVRLRIGARA